MNTAALYLAQKQFPSGWYFFGMVAQGTNKTTRHRLAYLEWQSESNVVLSRSIRAWLQRRQRTALASPLYQLFDFSTRKVRSQFRVEFFQFLFKVILHLPHRHFWKPRRFRSTCKFRSKCLIFMLQ
uniref:Uncharacterized protein n=1 Tax=Parascaris equorum TaxID=6256 RepID=A0A914R1M0_PAREQ